MKNCMKHPLYPHVQAEEGCNGKPKTELNEHKLSSHAAQQLKSKTSSGAFLFMHATYNVNCTKLFALQQKLASW